MQLAPAGPKVTVIGSLHADLTVKTERIPEIGETVLGGKLKISPGGKGANQAVAAARLGAQVTLVGRVGNDEFGKMLINSLNVEGVDVRHVVKDEREATGIALITVDRGGNVVIAVAPGADTRCSKRDVDKAKPVMKSSEVLLLQLEIPPAVVERAIDVAYENGVKVILNLAPARKISDELLKKVYLLTLNEVEASLLSGVEVKDVKSAKVAAKKILERGAQSVVLTLGEKGCVLATEGEIVHLKGIKVKAVDTTGAGDAFCGALAVAIASGKSLRDAAIYANCAGALATTAIGAQEALPTKAKLEHFVRRIGFQSR